MALEAELNLSALSEAFSRWRQTRRPRHIPTELRINAVALLSQHRTTEILRTLRLDHRTLMRWKRAYDEASESRTPPTPPGFIALPATAAPVDVAAREAQQPSLKVTRHGDDGTVLSLEGRLTLAQWRLAVTLLGVEEAMR